MDDDPKANLAAPVAVRLPNETYQTLLGMAELANTSVGKIIRQKLVATDAQTLTINVSEKTQLYTIEDIERAAEAALKAKHAQRIKSSEEKKQVLYLFNKTSNNINQLAHRANLEYKAGIISDETYQTILDELHDLKQAMTELVKALA